MTTVQCSATDNVYVECIPTDDVSVECIPAENVTIVKRRHRPSPAHPSRQARRRAAKTELNCPNCGDLMKNKGGTTAFRGMKSDGKYGNVFSFYSFECGDTDTVNGTVIKGCGTQTYVTPEKYRDVCQKCLQNMSDCKCGDDGTPFGITWKVMSFEQRTFKSPYICPDCGQPKKKHVCLKRL